MKISLKIILLLFFTINSFSQSKKSLQKMADEAEKIFTWDIEKMDKGTLMFLDVPYQRENQDLIEYLTLTVAKNKSEKRPKFISMILPNNIVKSNGIFIKFGNDKLEDAMPVRVEFESCDNETCTARIINGYIDKEDTKEKIDVFEKFLNFKHVYFLFIFPDGSHKSVAVPLYIFKRQYSKLD
jgi:hypothetical protein